MDAQLVTFLRDKHIVRIATCKNGRPHVVPLWYVYDANEVGMMSGFFPARSAAKLRPVEALRHA